MNKHRCIFTIFFLLAVPVFLAAQTADEIEMLLQTEAVSYEQAARFVLDAAEVYGNYNRYSPGEAFNFAAGKRWLPKKVDPEKKINLRQVSLLIMRAFNMKGGFLYSLFKSPYLAYREMLYQDIIFGRADSGMAVSGDTLLYMVNRVLYRMDEDPWFFIPELLPEPEELAIPEKKIEEEIEDYKTDGYDIAQSIEIEEPEPDDFSGPLAQNLQWLDSYAEDGEAYVFELNADESIAPHYLYYDGRTISITIKGDNIERILSLRRNGYMFRVGSGVTLILDSNVTLKGRNSNNNSLVNVSGGNFVLNGGAKVTGNTALYGGGVYLLSGTFTMNGGEISGNRAFYGGGIYAGWEKTFTMHNGKISGNTAFYGGGAYVSSEGTFAMTGGEVSANAANSYGGGVYVSSDGTFAMTGGRISENIASRSGGGVYVSDGIFSKTRGIIYGYARGDSNSNAVKDYSSKILSSQGHAVYASNWSGSVIKLKETTAGPNVNLSFDKTGLQMWGGDWDN